MILGLLWASPVWAQESPGSSEKIQHPWLVGITGQFDGISYQPSNQQFSDSSEFFIGPQVFVRHDPWFGTGGHLLFSQKDNALEVGLDARYFFPLPLVEPYMGANLSFLTRDAGGFSLALRPGVFVQAIPHFTLDFFLLGRYDLFYQAFGTPVDGKDLIHVGLGASVLYRF